MNFFSIINKALIYSFFLFGFCLSIEGNVYHDTIKQIKKIYSLSNNHSHVDFLNLDIIKSEKKFHQFLEELSNNDQNVLYDISAYYHPAGFIKIVLYKGQRGEQMRFHFWGKGGEKAIQQEFDDGWEPIHNHRWNFSSKVIKGGLDVREYFDVDSRIRFDIKKEANQEKKELNDSYKIYDVHLVPTRKGNGDDYKILRTGKFAVIGNFTEKYIKQNITYYLDHRIPHQVKPDANTSTLLLIDPPSKLVASEIFITKNDKFQEEFELQDLSPEETQRYLKEFLETL